MLLCTLMGINQLVRAQTGQMNSVGREWQQRKEYRGNSEEFV
jgi:hypothetical protein